MAISEKLVKKVKASSKAASGEIVRTTDGRVLFLTTKEVKKCTVARNHHAPLKRLRARGTHPTTLRRAAGCRAFRRWLLTHNPNTKFWREVYVDWVNNC